jgi:dephospho-CoA kinase
MLIVGLTGGIGSGKSSASKVFEKLDIPIIDADVISHKLTSKGSVALKEISQQLSPGFINSKGELERKKLAQYIFEHTDKKILLEAILHPRVKTSIINELNQITDSAYAIVVVPLLLETNFTDVVDRILVIDSSEETRKQRVTDRDHRTASDVLAIINQQIDDKTRREKADDIIDNNGSLSELESLIRALHKQYLQISSKYKT